MLVDWWRRERPEESWSAEAAGQGQEADAAGEQELQPQAGPAGLAQPGEGTAEAEASGAPPEQHDLTEELSPPVPPWQAMSPTAPAAEAAPRQPGSPLRGRRLARPEDAPSAFTPQERLLILDSWLRSGLPAGDFAPLVGLSKHTLYGWKKRFDQHGPGGLLDHPRGARLGSKLPEVTKRTILLLKDAHPEWGVQRISDELVRGPALPASPAAVARVLHEAGYVLVDRATDPHPEKVQHFERAKPNQLWQTDLFTFVLKRTNRRVYLVAFLDDHSRFVVGYGLYGSSSTALVLEVLRAALAGYGRPEEILTDNGPQYVTWRGKSQFSRELERQGIRQLVARPKHPQTLGKIERFWGTLWRDCVEAAVFLDLEDARRRIGLFIDHYNFQRPHQGLEGLVPADRFFGAAPTVLAALKERVAANALELARQGVPKAPFYVTGQVAGQNFSLHAEGERVILSRAGEPRQEVELVAPPATEAAAPLPLAVCPCGVPAAETDAAEGEEPTSPGVAGWEASSAAGAAGPPTDRAHEGGGP
jgi:transposase InsO family protein